MIKIRISDTEFYNEDTQTFEIVKSQELVLEHSLVSLSKWESRWHKPFLQDKEMTEEETIDYIKCMTITQNVDPIVYMCIDQENMIKIKDYISNPMTATTFSDNDKKHSRRIVTSELIYYWMIGLQIPFECQKWHLNRLLTLIKVCNIENSPKKNMKQQDVFKQNHALNDYRKKMNKTRG